MFPKFRRELVKKTINNGSSAGKDHQLSLNILQLFCNIRTRIVAVSIQYTQNTFSYQQGQNCSQKRNDLLQQKYVSDKIDIDASIGRKIQKNTSKGPTKIASFKSQNCFQKFLNVSRPIGELKTSGCLPFTSSQCRPFTLPLFFRYFVLYISLYIT